MTRYRVLPAWEEVQQVSSALRRHSIWHAATLGYFECPFQAAAHAARLEGLHKVRWVVVADEGDGTREHTDTWVRTFRMYKETGALLDPGPLALV